MRRRGTKTAKCPTGSGDKTICRYECWSFITRPGIVKDSLTVGERQHLTPSPSPPPPLHSCPENKVIYILISCQTWSDQASSGWLVGKNWEAPTERSGEEQNKLTEFHLDLSSCLNIKYEKFNSFLLFWLTLYFSGGFCMFFFDKDNFDILNRNCCQRTEPTRVGLI